MKNNIMKEYVVLSRAYYAHDEVALLESTVKDDIIFSAVDENGSSLKEGSFELHKFDVVGKGAIRLCLFEDSWRILVDTPELFTALASLTDPVWPDSIEKLLQDAGYQDTTPTTRP